MNDNLSLDRCPQLVSYFAEFLQEIGLVISSIRGYAFQLIDLTMPVPQANYVCSSMSSVIHNTHRTYQTLKKLANRASESGNLAPNIEVLVRLILP